MSADTVAERTFLITGGTGGVGLEAARRLHAEGARVIIGSRDPAHYADAATSLGGERVHPFVADLTSRPEVAAQVEALRRAGVQPTDVIHSAAGGMEPVLRDLVRLMIGLKSVRGEAMNEAQAAVRAEMTPLVDQSRDFAMTVNCRAPSALLELVTPSMPRGGTVTFYSHLWASLYPHPQVPIYYDGVAESKHAFEKWLEARSADWASRGITTAIISTNLILNTRMGTLLDRFCASSMPHADRETWRANFVSCAELVDATFQVLERAATEPAGLVRLYIPAPGEVVGHIARDHPAVAHPVALAQHAPTWSGEASKSRA